MKKIDWRMVFIDFPFFTNNFYADHWKKKTMSEKTIIRFSLESLYIALPCHLKIHRDNFYQAKYGFP